MTRESHPQSVRNENVEASPEWETGSSLVDGLGRDVDSLIIGYNLVRENSAERNERLQELLECKAQALALQEQFKYDHMPLLPDRTALIIKKIQETLNQKLN